jgi:predicted ArsR family transcriptional regulator
MSPDAPGSSRERVLFLLKTKGPQTASRMAKKLRVTTMAVRQHLAVLQGEGFVNFTDERRKVGRPPRVWQLTSKAYDRFPDCHAELAVGMLEAIRSAFGDQGLERLTEERTRQQAGSYRTRMPEPDAPIEERVATLARLRREEGYMAEWARGRDGALELVQNHCSIAKAAQFCSKLCAGELSLFRTVLGDDVSVERVEHLLRGDRRCAFRKKKFTFVSKTSSSSPKPAKKFCPILCRWIAPASRK